LKALLHWLLHRLGPRRQARLAGAALRHAIATAPPALLERLVTELETFELAAEDRLRQLRHPTAPVPQWDPAGLPEPLTYHVMSPTAPWMRLPVPDIAVPGMLAPEEIQYYSYISRFYTGQGEVVELGPWLGLSTHHLIRSLSANPRFAGKQLHVFDDFVWRSDWMDPNYPPNPKPAHHSDFQPLFERYAAPIRSRLRVTRAKFTNYDGNEALPVATWDGQPIELIVVDCGRSIEANEGWWRIFAESFLPNRTLVVMQDWRLHRERPRKPFNQTLYFTAKHPRLELVHEVNQGGIATFLYR
jgi:hypothetical protein